MKPPLCERRLHTAAMFTNARVAWTRHSIVLRVICSFAFGCAFQTLSQIAAPSALRATVEAHLRTLRPLRLTVSGLHSHACVELNADG